MSVEIVDAGQDNEEQTSGTMEQQATPPIDPQVMARQIATEVLSGLRPSEQESMPTEDQFMESVVKELVEQGYQPDAIKAVLKLTQATRVVEKMARAKEQTEQRQIDKSEQIWLRADESLSQYEAVLPGLKTSDPFRKAMLQAGRDVYASSTDPVIAADRTRAEKGAMPSRAALDKAHGIAVEKFCSENGITKKESGLDLRSSKPEASNASTDSADGLSLPQKKLYSAIMSVTGDEKQALKNARLLKAV